MTRSKEELAAILAEESDAIEAAEFGPGADPDSDEPLPDHVTVRRGGGLRSKTIQSRVTPEEYAAIEAMARHRGVTVSTLVRDLVVAAASRPAGASVGVLLDQMQAQLVQVRIAADELVHQ